MADDEDRNFDDLAERFERNIYGSIKGEIRLSIVWEDLLEAVPELETGPPLRILDAGVGLGQLALRLADYGHELVLCDISEQMLSRAQKQFEQEAPEARVRILHTPVQNLPQELEGSFDLVLFHAVLEWLAEPQTTLQGVLRFLKPQGKLSLLFYNRHALLFRHLMLGNFQQLRAGYLVGRKRSFTPDNPLKPEDVYGWLNEWGMERISTSGIRTFTDYLSREVEEKLELETALVLERQLSREEPFRSLGRYIHVIADRKESSS